MMVDRPRDGEPDLVPRPDPTLLTTQQLVREIAGLRVELTNAIAAVREILETRLNGNDRAIELLRSSTDLLPQRIDEKITALRAVHEERFKSIATQFLERDVRDERSTRDGKTAVDAALQAQKEAANATQISNALSIAKSEASTDKRIDQQAAAIATSEKAKDATIADIKDRLTRIEGMGQGKQQQTGQWIAVAGLLVAAAVLVSRFL